MLSVALIRPTIAIWSDCCDNVVHCGLDWVKIDKVAAGLIFIVHMYVIDYNHVSRKGASNSNGIDKIHNLIV